MNTYDEILERLRENMPSDISVMEGTFSGDILGSVANELAKFYSQDIESIYEKAFVKTAYGQWLDLACSDWGVIRDTSVEEPESDESLRARTMKKISAQSASGNISNYKEWAMEVAGVSGVQVKPLARGNGTVDVYIIGIGDDLCSRVTEHIKAVKPIGADVLVEDAVPFAVQVSAKIKIANGVDKNSVKESINHALAYYYDGLNAQTGAPYISEPRVSAVILGVPGVQDITGLVINGATGGIQLDYKQYPKVGENNITEMGV